MKVLSLGRNFAATSNDSVVFAQFQGNTSMLDFDVVVLYPYEIILSFCLTQPLDSGVYPVRDSTVLDKHWRLKKALIEEFIAEKKIIIVSTELPVQFLYRNEIQGVSFFLRQLGLDFVGDFKASVGSRLGAAGSPMVKEFVEGLPSEFRYSAVFSTSEKDSLLSINGASNTVISAHEIGESVCLLAPFPYTSSTKGISSKISFEKTYLESLIKLSNSWREQKVSAFSLPEWHTKLRTEREVDLASGVELLQTQIDALVKNLETKNRELSEEQVLKTLLYGSGTALEKIVHKVLQEFGLVHVKETSTNKVDILMRIDEFYFLFEIKGRNSSGAESDVMQLVKWEQDFLNAYPGKKYKTILVVNGYADLPLSERQTVFPDQMLNRAKGNSVCLVTGLQLFNLNILLRENKVKAGEILDLLKGTVGIFQGFDDLSCFIK